MKMTPRQTEAVETEGSNIIVSAGAGSGKTAVLSQRVLRKVQSGIDIRKILILTFTNEAAGEMKNRIRKKLNDNKLVEPLEYLDCAYITTFDAYALSLVKKYHYLLNITPSITIIDSSIISLEKKQILETIFDEYYQAKNPLFLRLIGDFTNRDDEVIKESILNISASLDLKYDKEKYLQSYIEEFYSDTYVSNKFDEYFKYIASLCEELENNVYALSTLIDEELYEKVSLAYVPYFRPHTYDDIYRQKDMPKVTFRNVPEEVEPIKKELKLNIKKIKELTEYSSEELKNNYLMTKDYVNIIIEIILKLDEKINAYKKTQGAFEFNDIAKMAIKIVEENETVRDELKNYFNEILIDEYQDTSDLQETFISFIENNNVYMVGDIKQSIYRFRNANPNIFKNKYEAYSNKDGGIKIDLLKNFRSRAEVLQNINEVFNHLMSREYGGVAYANNHEMVFGNNSYIENGKTDYDYKMKVYTYYENKKYDNTEIEAFIIAKDIKEKVNNKYQVYDFELSTLRDITYNDFCIILDRSTNMPIYKKIFEYLGIELDVYQDSNLVLEMDLAIIKNIISLILSIKDKDYAKMRYCFTSIARSFIGGLTDDEILTILNDNTIYDSEIYLKAKNFINEINYITPSILLERILTEFNFYEKYLNIGNIKTGRKRLFYILDLASNAENLGFNITEFRDYLDEMIINKKEIRYKEERGIGNCVKIMNIHKSKGLEFPICYFAGFKPKFNMQDIKERFLYDDTYGIITPCFKEGINNVFTKTLVQNKVITEEISEKIRLFYVALTRAKEQIIMITPEFKKPSYQKGVVDDITARKYRSFYDFISSIALNLKDYTTKIDLNNINLTKDYEFKAINKNHNIKGSKEQITFKTLNIDMISSEAKHASKTIKKIITKEEAETLEYGTKMHEMLEMTDFNNKTTNKYILKLKDTFDFLNATIYQELEFYYDLEDTTYHGIIDLMLEYETEIKIIDYKLKNIDDEAYIKQLSVYYNYVKKVSNKDIKLYLYSILDNKVKEITYVKE